jgi:hypothetical protein
MSEQELYLSWKNLAKTKISITRITTRVSPMEEGVNDNDVVVQDLGLLQDHLTDSTKSLHHPFSIATNSRGC